MPETQPIKITDLTPDEALIVCHRQYHALDNARATILFYDKLLAEAHPSAFDGHRKFWTVDESQALVIRHRDTLHKAGVRKARKDAGVIAQNIKTIQSGFGITPQDLIEALDHV